MSVSRRWRRGTAAQREDAREPAPSEVLAHVGAEMLVQQLRGLRRIELHVVDEDLAGRWELDRQVGVRRTLGHEEFGGCREEADLIARAVVWSSAFLAEYERIGRTSGYLLGPAAPHRG